MAGRPVSFIGVRVCGPPFDHVFVNMRRFLARRSRIAQSAPRNSLSKKALYLSLNVSCTKALIGHTIFTSRTGDQTAILLVNPSHAKVSPFAGQRQYLHFSVVLRP